MTLSKSISSQKNISKSELLRKKKKDVHTKKNIFWMILSFCLFFLSIGFFWLPFFQIKKNTVNELSTISQDDFTNFVNTELSGTKFFILPKRNVFLVNKKKLVDTIKKQYATIDTIKIKKEFTSLTFDVMERSPDTIWCKSITEKDSCYFVHKDGLIFEKAGNFSNPLFFVFYTPLQNSDTPISSYVLSLDAFNRIAKVRELLLNYGIKIYGYQTDLEGNEMFFIKPIILGQNDPVSIKTDMVQSPETIASKVVTALKSELLRDEKKKNFRGVHYIDIRFENKVYVDSVLTNN